MNTLAEAVDLQSWTVEDRDGNPDLLNQQLQAGEAKTITLSGQGARLSNKGGSITLKDSNGVRVHSVTYLKNDVVEQGRTLLF